tara:strand:+ start:81 stop:455 length:375 start_codon:yes stop_codon:yes gene_type:complete
MKKSYTLIVLLFSILSYSQDFYKAKEKKDLNFKYKTRTLKTSLKKINEFEVNYLNTNYTLNQILREKLHTSIHLNQPENVLITYGGSAINLPKNLNSNELTSIVVELIGNMYIGQSEVRKINMK